MWIYALRTTINLLSKVPSKVFPRTPFQLWTCTKPTLRNLHVWGCLTEVRVYKHKKRNWTQEQLMVPSLVIQKNKKGIDLSVLHTVQE